MNCRICFDELERDLLICPCLCAGSMKYVCKKCLSHYISLNVNTHLYSTCPTCKFHYKRDSPGVENIKVETTVACVLGVGAITTACVGAIELSKFKQFFIIITIINYILTLIVMADFVSRDEMVTQFALLMLLIVNVIPLEFAYKLNYIWIVALFSYYSYLILPKLWSKFFLVRYNYIVSKLGCKMYDYDLKKFVTGC